jgi:hypothetical protein
VKRLQRQAGTIGCWLLFAAVAAAFVELKMVRPAATPGDPRGGDLLAYYYPMLKYGFAQLRSGQLPLWDPYQSCGTPFLAVPNIGLFYPLYLPYLLLDAATAFDLDVLVHLVIASVAMFLLCRHFGLGRAASWVAGIVYTYSGGMLLKVYFPNFIAPVVFIPLIFLLVDDILWRHTWRSSALLAAVVGVTLLGGNVQFSYFTALALLPFALTRAAVAGRARGGGAVAAGGAGLAVAALLALLVAAVRVLPAVEYMGDTWRPPGSLDVRAASVMAIGPRQFVTNLFTPGPPPPGRSVWSSTDVAREAYVGVIPLLLALVGLVRWKERSISVPIALAGVAAVFYAFGTATPFYAWIFTLPGGSWFRGLDRALIVFAFAIAVLCGAGLDVLLRRAPRGTSAGAATVGGKRAGATGVLLAAAGATVLALGLALGNRRGSALLEAHWAIGMGALGLVWGLGARTGVRMAGVATIALLIVCDLFQAHNYPGVLPSQLGAYLSQHERLFEQIRERQGLYRTYIWSSADRSAPLPFYSDIAKAGLLHGIWMVTDYEPLSARRIDGYLSALGPGWLWPMGYHTFHLTQTNVRLLQLMGVRYLALPTGQEAAVMANWAELSTRLRLISRRDAVSLYEYGDAMPRSFVVDRVEVEPQADRLLARLAQADLRQVAFVEEAPAGDVLPTTEPPGGPSHAEIVAYAANRVTIETTAPDGGFLVLTDQYYPGWRAFVDGSPLPIYRTDYLFRGVRIPPGTHRVEFTYRPTSFYLGALASTVGVAAIGLVLVAHWFQAARRATRSDARV